MEKTTIRADHSYCLYYQAIVSRPDAWFVVATLKTFDHLVLDRTIDVAKSLFEFFVPHQQNKQFLEVMRSFEARGMVTNLCQLPNRLREMSQKV